MAELLFVNASQVVTCAGPARARRGREMRDAGVLTGAKLALPPVKVQAEFAAAITPLRRLLNNLIDQNANLRTSRDLLLPMLVSGEIDVSDLDIDTEWLSP